MDSIITHAEQLGNLLQQTESMPVPTNVLMVTPDYYSVDYVINPHMEGRIGTVNTQIARWQWEVIRDKFRHFGLKVHVLTGQPELPDMVFSANQSLPVIDKNRQKHAVMSIMHSEHRKDEVPHFEQWYRQNGYEIHYLDAEGISGFEGMGDAIWHFKKRLIWGGYGFRTSPKAYNFIAEKFDIPVVLLELVNPAFYHLDTCFCILDSNTVLIYPKAFSNHSLELVRTAFPKVIEAPDDEAQKLFACNAVCPDGRNVIIQKGCRYVNKLLKENRFNFHEVDTAEFLKSGGSVFCMKLLLW